MCQYRTELTQDMLGENQLQPPSSSYSPLPSFLTSMPSQDYGCCVERTIQNMPPLPRSNNTAAKMRFFERLFEPCAPYDRQFHGVTDSFKSAIRLYKEGKYQCTSLHCDQKTRSEMILYVIILAATLLVGVFGNLMACSIIYKIRSLHRHTTYKLLFSMAISDLLASVVVIPIKIAIALDNMNFCYDVSLCRIQITADVTFFVASVTHLLFVSLDRYFSILKPYRSSFIQTHWKSCIALIWLNAILWGVVLNNIDLTPPYGSIENVFDVHEYRCINNDLNFVRSLYSVDFFFPCIVMIFLYHQIWRVAVRQSREIERFKGKPPRPLADFIPTQLHHQQDQSQPQQQHQQHRQPLNKESECDKRKPKTGRQILRFFTVHFIEFKATKVILVVFGIFLLCYTPVCFLGFLHTFKPFVISTTFFTVLEYLPNLNSCLNPFIYCFFHEDFKNGFRKLLDKASLLKTHRKSVKRRLRKKNKLLKNATNANGVNILVIGNDSQRQ